MDTTRTDEWQESIITSGSIYGRAIHYPDGKRQILFKVEIDASDLNHLVSEAARNKNLKSRGGSIHIKILD